MGAALLLAAIGMAVVFDVTNGFHDSANSVAALVATRAATPAQALAVATAGNFAGALLLGTAVANTVGGVVIVAPDETVPAIGAALTAAIGWNLVTWRLGLPSSSSHALIGGLVGAAVAAGGMAGVRWGGFAHGRPEGVVGVLTGLAISPVLGVLVGAVGILVAGRLLRRARREFDRVVRRGEWLTASALACSHGANDAQKTMGVVALLLLATGHLSSFSVPIWVRLMAAGSLTIGTAFGGWRIVRTVGSGHLPDDPVGWTRQPGRVRGGDIGRRGPRRPGQHHARRRLECGRRRNAATHPPCELVRGARDRGCVVDHAADQCRGGGCGVPTLE